MIKIYPMKKLNPLIIIILWVLGCSLLTLIIMIILGVTTPGGEQQPLTFLSMMISVIVYGILVLAIFTIPFYSAWSRKYWWLHAVLIISCSLIIFISGKNKVKTEFTESDIDIFVNGKKYLKRIKYYDNDLKIRSITFMNNDKKDSIWTIYSKDGHVISRLKYKNDILIETLK